MAGAGKLKRALRALPKHAQAAAWILLLAGVAAFALLPLAAKRCYLDEKALLVGGSLPTVRQSGAVEACVAAVPQLERVASSGGSSSGAAFEGVARAAAAAAGLDLYQHHFALPTAGSKSSSSSQVRQCSTLHMVVRAPRGDGTEAFVLALPLDAAAAPRAAALAAAAGAALAGHLRRSGWLAKDTVLLFLDAGCGAEAGAQAWLAAHNSGADLFAFPRAGLLQQALVLEVAGGGAASGGAPGTAELSVHGAGGQLPNLDLYYLVKRNVDLHTSLPVSLRASAAPLPPLVRSAAAAAAAAAAALGVSPPAAAQQYAGELQTLAAFSAQLASGEGTGAHAAFLAQQVDAATLTLRLAAAAKPGPGSGVDAARAHTQLQLAAYATLAPVEMILRTFNNLQERLHHSTALFVLLSPDRFASIAAYLAPPGCLLAAALAQLAASAQRAHGAPAEAWRAAWRRVALAHVCGWMGAFMVATFGGWRPGSGELAALAKQLLWVAAAGLAAATGPPALLQAVKAEAAGEADGGQPAALQAQACTAAVGLAAAVLQGCAMLMGQWVRCTAFLLAVVPAYALSLGHRPSRPAALAAKLLACVAAWALPRALGRAGAPWLAAPLLSHLLAACFSLQ